MFEKNPHILQFIFFKELQTSQGQSDNTAGGEFDLHAPNQVWSLTPHMVPHITPEVILKHKSQCKPWALLRCGVENQKQTSKQRWASPIPIPLPFDFHHFFNFIISSHKFLNQVYRFNPSCPAVIFCKSVCFYPIKFYKELLEQFLPCKNFIMSPSVRWREAYQHGVW